jgi:hypothetical protein
MPGFSKPAPLVLDMAHLCMTSSPSSFTLWQHMQVVHLPMGQKVTYIVPLAFIPGVRDDEREEVVAPPG